MYPLQPEYLSKSLPTPSMTFSRFFSRSLSEIYFTVVIISNLCDLFLFKNKLCQGDGSRHQESFTVFSHLKSRDLFYLLIVFFLFFLLFSVFSTIVSFFFLFSIFLDLFDLIISIFKFQTHLEIFQSRITNFLFFVSRAVAHLSLDQSTKVFNP